VDAPAEAAVLPDDVKGAVGTNGDIRNDVAVRSACPVSGSVTPTVRRWSTTMGSDQVTPLSVERMTSTKTPGALTPDPLKFVKTSTSVPSGSTTI